ncbi:MAG: T9SS type A sorting domain-containing protein [Prevotella sp.]|nr:T9SS type A sorting domain-containing protein [Prevotella sp.]
MQRKTIMLRLFAFFLFASTFVEAHALNVEFLTFMVKGKPIVISLAEHPVITYTENTLHITSTVEETSSGGGSSTPVVTTIDIPVDEMSESASFAAGISRPVIERPNLEAGKLLFSQLPAGSHVTVYTTDGKIVSKAAVDSDGQVVVDILHLPSGIYVVKSASQTIKITNK